MITPGAYYLAELAGDRVLPLSEHDSFAAALNAQRAAQAVRPASVLGIGCNSSIQLVLGHRIFTLYNSFDGAFWVEDRGGFGEWRSANLGAFASISAALAAMQAYQPPEPADAEDAA